MRRTLAMASLAGLAAGLTACHTITEDLPSRPSSVIAPGSIPVVSVPLPALTPGPIPPSPSSPIVPSPTPRPNPTPVPGGGGGGGGGEPPTTNTSPVARLNANVYFIECGGVPMPDSSRATTAPVGCRVHLDCTARDGSNAPTVPRGTPRWTYSNPGLITVSGNSPFNPVITGNGRGHVDFYAEVDGVRSETRGIDFE
jgi:hypothetical protein